MAPRAPDITPAPQFFSSDDYGAREDFLKREVLVTYSSCNMQCDDGAFCMGIAPNYGLCCPNSVLSRSSQNWCEPVTACVEYGQGGVSGFFFDETRSIQYCGKARPHCATYIYTSDSYTQVFCGKTQTGRYYFDTTAPAGRNPEFLSHETDNIEIITHISGSGTSNSARIASTTLSTSPSRETSETSARSTSPLVSKTSSTTDSTTIPNTSSQNTTSNTLSAGAIAGIVLGILFSILLIGLAIIFFIRHRRRNSAPKGTPSDPAELPQPPPPTTGTAYQQNSDEKEKYGITSPIENNHLRKEIQELQGEGAPMGHHGESNRRHEYQARPGYSENMAPYGGSTEIS